MNSLQIMDHSPGFRPQTKKRWSHNISFQLTLLELAICRERSWSGVIGKRMRNRDRRATELVVSRQERGKACFGTRRYHSDDSVFECFPLKSEAENQNLAIGHSIHYYSSRWEIFHRPVSAPSLSRIWSFSWLELVCFSPHLTPVS